MPDPTQKNSDSDEPPNSHAPDDDALPACRVLVVHNRGLDEDGADIGRMKECEDEVVDVARIVGETLTARGHTVSSLALDGDTAPLVARLDAGDVDVVFNLVESLGGDAAREPEIPTLLAARGLAFTGNSAHVLSLAFAKDRVRDALVEGDVPVARALVVDDDHPLPAEREIALSPPLFVKPARVDGSIGIDQGSVVADHAALAARVALLRSTFGGAVLVEEYLPGVELNVAVCPDLGGVCAPTLLDFSGFKEGQWPVVTYQAKWVEGHDDYNCRSVALTDQLTDEEKARVLETARAALQAIGADGYARVDMRLDAARMPRVIDVNPNPALHPEAGFALALGTVQVSFADVVVRIVRHALHRRDGTLNEVNRASSRPLADRSRPARGDALSDR